MSTRPLFVTQVYEASFAAEKGFAAFNAELEEACRMLADEDLAGQRWCRCPRCCWWGRGAPPCRSGWRWRLGWPRCASC